MAHRQKIPSCNSLSNCSNADTHGESLAYESGTNAHHSTSTQEKQIPPSNGITHTNLAPEWRNTLKRTPFYGIMGNFPQTKESQFSTEQLSIASMSAQ